MPLYAQPSPLGPLSLETDDAGRLTALCLDRPSAAPLPPPAIAAAITAYFAGELAALDRLAVAPAGTQFQQRVWAQLRAIPPGETRSYQALATALGQPGAARAIGLANGRNPVALVIPCHRVIGADGRLTGYAGGLAAKAWLLTHECAIPQHADLFATRP
jgi:methylated-DNA-[protein]-cysteine S-methyltransferase